MSIDGLLLAAGAGRRMGGPKALVRDDDGTSWLQRSVEVLREGGCDRVLVVLGAAVDEPRRLLHGSGVQVVVAPDWADGMSASLRAGLGTLTDGTADAAAVTLVDLPDVGAAVVRRVLAAPVSTATLRRATYDGRPGHPVLFGRDHWAAVGSVATGDRGGSRYLQEQGVDLVECGDLATGRDVDSR